MSLADLSRIRRMAIKQAPRPCFHRRTRLFHTMRGLDIMRCAEAGYAVSIHHDQAWTEAFEAEARRLGYEYSPFAICPCAGYPEHLPECGFLRRDEGWVLPDTPDTLLPDRGGCLEPRDWLVVHGGHVHVNKPHWRAYFDTLVKHQWDAFIAREVESQFSVLSEDSSLTQDLPQVKLVLPEVVQAEPPGALENNDDLPQADHTHAAPEGNPIPLPEEECLPHSGP